MLRNISWSTEQTWALGTILDWYTLSRTSLGWARRGTPAWIWSMWAQGLATSLCTHRPWHKKKREGTQRDGVVLRETFRQGQSQRQKSSTSATGMDELLAKIGYGLPPHWHKHKLLSLSNFSPQSNVWHACVCLQTGGLEHNGACRVRHGRAFTRIPGECSTSSKQGIMTHHVRRVGDTEWREGRPLTKILMCITRSSRWVDQCSRSKLGSHLSRSQSQHNPTNLDAVLPPNMERDWMNRSTDRRPWLLLLSFFFLSPSLVIWLRIKQKVCMAF